MGNWKCVRWCLQTRDLRPQKKGVKFRPWPEPRTLRCSVTGRRKVESTGREQDTGDSGTSRNSNDTGRDMTTLRSTSDLHQEGFMGRADLWLEGAVVGPKSKWRSTHCASERPDVSHRQAAEQVATLLPRQMHSHHLPQGEVHVRTLRFRKPLASVTWLRENGSPGRTPSVTPLQTEHPRPTTPARSPPPSRTASPRQSYTTAPGSENSPSQAVGAGLGPVREGIPGS